MDTDIIITNISRHRGNESRYNEEIHKKQSKIQIIFASLKGNSLSWNLLYACPKGLIIV